MKSLITALVLLLPLTASAQPAIRFVTERHDFGSVTSGIVLEYPFAYTNEGKEDLIVSDATTFT